MSAMRVLDRTGDSEIRWDPSNTDEVTAARKMFNELKGKGFMAYRLEGSERGEVIREFDPNAEELVMAPALRGG